MSLTFRERFKQGFSRSPLAPLPEKRELFVRMVDVIDQDGGFSKTPVSFRPDPVDGYLFSVDPLLQSGNTDLLRPTVGIQPTFFQSADAIPDDFVLTPEMLHPSNLE